MSLHLISFYFVSKNIKQYIKRKYCLNFCANLISSDNGEVELSWEVEDVGSLRTPSLKYRIKNELIRYICIPTQALSYKVGELTFLFLRDLYLKNNKNNIKDYHKFIMDIGPCPLDLLIKEFIKKNMDL